MRCPAIDRIKPDNESDSQRITNLENKISWLEKIIMKDMINRKIEEYKNKYEVDIRLEKAYMADYTYMLIEDKTISRIESTDLFEIYKWLSEGTTIVPIEAYLYRKNKEMSK